MFFTPIFYIFIFSFRTAFSRLSASDPRAWVMGSQPRNILNRTGETLKNVHLKTINVFAPVAQFDIY